MSFFESYLITLYSYPIIAAFYTSKKCILTGNVKRGCLNSNGNGRAIKLSGQLWFSCQNGWPGAGEARYARLPAEVMMIFEPSLWPQACVNAATRCNKRVITREY
eukprot:scaffold250640_cov52-Attheya_sp.AAC.1